MDERDATTRKTGDEERAGIDPGGTRPTRPAESKTPQVESGDRNTMTDPAPAMHHEDEA